MRATDPNPTRAAPATAGAADAVRLGPIRVFETSRKVRMGKWPEMAAFPDRRPALAAGQGILSAPPGPEVAVLAGAMAGPHRDPSGRIVAAPAGLSGAVLRSADAMVDTRENGGLQRVCSRVSHALPPFPVMSDKARLPDITRPGKARRFAQYLLGKSAVAG